MDTADLTPRLDNDLLPRELIKKLPKWREQYGLDLFYLQTCGGVVFRPFTRGELVRYEVGATVDPVTAQQALLKPCILHPSWDELQDGISLAVFGALLQAVWKTSGFHDPEAFEDDLNAMRVLCQEKDHVIIRMICQAFPRYKPEDVDALSRDKILYLLAQAECVLGTTYDGREAQEVIGELVQKAQAERHKELMRLKAAGHNVPMQRFFNWPADRAAMDSWEQSTE